LGCPVRVGALAIAPRFALVLLVERVEECARLAAEAERGGFEMLGIVDSQSVSADVYVCLAAAALATSRIRLGPAVTNPVTRHAAVTANAMATLDGLAPGRTFLGLGAGDSAVFTLGLPPARLAALEESARDLRTLTAGGTVERAGHRVRIKNAARPIPLYLAADGPRARQLAGRVADGVFVGSGLTAAEVAGSRADIAAGARAAGRAPDALDVWWLVKANVADSRAAAVDEIKGTLVSSGNRVFRAMAAPEPFREAIARLQQAYDPLEHAALGAAGNGRLSDDAALTAYLAERFAIAGTPDDCAAQVQRAVAAGADKLLLTAITPDPRRFIHRWATEVMPRCLDRRLQDTSQNRRT
jgi:5,10-methylenetetrahydromethanopterin reductase